MIPKNPQTSKTASRSGLDPQVVKVVSLLNDKDIGAPCEHVLAAFAKVDEAYPGLSFKQFFDALLVLELFEKETGGHA